MVISFGLELKEFMKDEVEGLGKGNLFPLSVPGIDAIRHALPWLMENAGALSPTGGGEAYSLYPSAQPAQP